LERDGPNEFSPPRQTPEWVRLTKHMFGGFSLLLWTAAIISFVAYSAETATLEEPPGDNVRKLQLLRVMLMQKKILHGCVDQCIIDVKLLALWY